MVQRDVQGALDLGKQDKGSVVRANSGLRVNQASIKPQSSCSTGPRIAGCPGTDTIAKTSKMQWGRERFEKFLPALI